jgi:hypothetical protein
LLRCSDLIIPAFHDLQKTPSWLFNQAGNEFFVFANFHRAAHCRATPRPKSTLCTEYEVLVVSAKDLWACCGLVNPPAAESRRATPTANRALADLKASLTGFMYQVRKHIFFKDWSFASYNLRPFCRTIINSGNTTASCAQRARRASKPGTRICTPQGTR